MLDFQSWSVKKKINMFGLSAVAGGIFLLACFLYTMQMISNTQEKYIQASNVNRYLKNIEMAYAEMAVYLSNYALNHSEENWRLKEIADQRAAEEYGNVKAMVMVSETENEWVKEIEKYKNTLEYIGEFDEKKLLPFDNAIKDLMQKNKKEEALSVLEKQFIPLCREVIDKLNEATMNTENDMEVYSKELHQYFKYSRILFAIFIAVICVGIYLVAKLLGANISMPLESAIHRLNQETVLARTSAQEISTASQSLASAASEQAAALQETAASVEEMSAMINKNADNAQRSGKASHEGTEVAMMGKKAAHEMNKAIHEINHSNNAIMKQVEESNQKLTEITKVIAEIANKTKVINDIVFQTKLLSFNASVEAARAGEHGKGFAVVAEEVGNLAQMSGNAAKEIGQMLSTSIEKVEIIVRDTKSQVEMQVAEGKSKVEMGTKIANQTAKVLDDVVEQVSKVNAMVNEIATASQEQASGVTEITKAMGQLDQVTHQNSNVSQQVASSAAQLNQQSLSLEGVVTELKTMVWGSSGLQVQNLAVSASEAKKSKPLAKPLDGKITNQKPELKRVKKIAEQVTEKVTDQVTEKTVQSQKNVSPSAPVAEKLQSEPVAKVVEASHAKPTKVQSAKPETAMAEEGIPSEDDPRFKEI